MARLTIFTIFLLVTVSSCSPFSEPLPRPCSRIACQPANCHSGYQLIPGNPAECQCERCVCPFDNTVCSGPECTSEDKEQGRPCGCPRCFPTPVTDFPHLCQSPQKCTKEACLPGTRLVPVLCGCPRCEPELITVVPCVSTKECIQPICAPNERLVGVPCGCPRCFPEDEFPKIV